MVIAVSGVLIQATETNTANNIIPINATVGTLGQATETDTAQIFTPATLTSNATVDIIGGENLSNLTYIVFDSYDLSTANVIKQGVGESTDVNGNLVVDLGGTGVANNDPITIVVTNYTTTPTVNSRAAVCYTNAVVA